MKRLSLALLSLLVCGSIDRAQSEVPIVAVPEIQPFAAHVRRLQDALTLAGAMLTSVQSDNLVSALKESNSELAATKVQAVLDSRVLFFVDINGEMRIKVSAGNAKAELLEGGWRTFLVKVRNDSGTTAELKVASPQAERLHNAPADTVRDRWLGLEMVKSRPLQPNLGGLPLEYRLIQLYSRDAGPREAKVSFNVGQGTQDLGFRNEVDILFQCQIAREVRLSIIDENGKPTLGSLSIRDSLGHVFPAPAKRLAPDFSFHPQIYRADGETLRLPEGRYQVEFQRGPESIPERQEVSVGRSDTVWRFKVVRWIDPSLRGWWSGDHHIHAAGCAHYDRPTEGVLATDMIRHVLGEDLKVGCNLTWGPCFDYQKQFFTGQDDKVSRFPYLLHYDVEVSQFGSHESGHLCLLRLREQMYPGGTSKNHWPKLGLNTLKWAKKQGALVGPAHSGWGLDLESTELPNFQVAPFNGIGANEYIVDVTHEVPGPEGTLVPAVDFLSMVDTPYPWELNIWYHTLNAGYRTRISGETDFPCIYGERVGIGRSYVKIEGALNYPAWCEGIRSGKNYVSDGLSHLMDFRANDQVMGENGSELRLAKAGEVKIEVEATALLSATPLPGIRMKKFNEQPYWHLERARIQETRKVAVELIENGFPVARTEIEADGKPQKLVFQHEVRRSGWLAVRILPSSHTNPIFVSVGNKPVRASKRSVQWCLEAVENCWRNKERFLMGDEHAQAVEAYDHARSVYRRRLTECEVD